MTTSLALMLAVGTYYSIYRGWLHLSLQGLGFYGAILLFMVIFMILLGLLRGYGMHLSKALPLTFVLFYVGLWTISPNLIDSIGELFPPLNGLLLILFIVSVIKTITAFFRHSSTPKDVARDLKHTNPAPVDEPEIDREISEDKKEAKLLKKKTLRLTNLEINTIEDIEDYIRQMMKVVEDKGNTIDRKEVEELSSGLQNISQKETILRRGMELINKHIHAYRTTHRKDLSELQQRLGEAKNKKQRKEIEEEITYQKRMLEALSFMEKYESRIKEFIDSFNQLLSTAIQKLKGLYPIEALSYLKHAYNTTTPVIMVYVG